MKLYLILSTNLAAPSALAQIAASALRGGVDWLQFRHKEPYSEEMLHIASEVRALCRSASVPFIVNDRFDIALLLDADGVHLGRSDVPIPVARQHLPKNMLIGASAGTHEELERAVQGGADYLGIGHIFPTITKEKTTPSLGVEGLRSLSICTSLPLFAIGGIDARNLASLQPLSLNGVAIASAICSSPNPERAALLFKEQLCGQSMSKSAT